MSLKWFLPLSLLLWTVPASSQMEGPECKDFSGLVDTEKERFEQIATFRNHTLSDNYDLHYHRLEWTIDPAVHYISGRVTSYFTVVQPMQDMYFDLATEMSVKLVSYHGQDLTFEQRAGDLLYIELPQPMLLGTFDSITVEYEGAPQAVGGRPFGRKDHQGVPVLWTLSEPYGAKEWWPCKQDLKDKVDSIDVWVTTPNAYRAASNGVLVSETEVGDDKLYFWKHRYPIPAYLVAVSVTNYAVYSDYVTMPGGDQLEVLNYVYPENLESAREETKATLAVMELFNDLFGPYPFAREKYGHAQFSWGGGMEHQTMSFMYNFSHYLQAHELAHQWFGDKITCGSWKDIWLNEGFATYADGLTYDFGIGPTDWRAWLQFQMDRVTSRPDGSVYVDDTTNVNRIFSGRLSYAKGAMLLHMLRWKLGDADFFQALRNYLADPRLAFGFARTNDLIFHLEQQSGQDLAEFFQDWFFGEGYPSYSIRWRKEGAEVFLTVEQSASHPSVDFFEMPIPVRFRGEGRDTTFVFDHTYSGQEFVVQLPFDASDIDFDPDLWILSAGNQILFVADSNQPALESTITLWPNPARQSLWIKGSGSTYSLQQAQINGVDGRLQLRTDLLGREDEIDISNLPPGFYMVRIFTSRGNVVKRLLKM